MSNYNNNRRVNEQTNRQMSSSTNRFRGNKELNDEEPWRKQRASPLRAECLKMCPDDEFKLRTENNMVNILEKQVVK